MSLIEAMIHRGYPLQCSDADYLMSPNETSNAISNTLQSTLWLRREMDLQYRRSLLYYSVYYNNLDRVRDCTSVLESLDYDDDPMWLDSRPECDSLLSAAAGNGNIEMVRFLIKSGASVNLQTTESHGALQTAAEEQYMNIVQLLLEYGALVNPPAQLERGATALQWAAITGNLNIARILLDRGADINALPAKSYGRTALEGAAEHGRLDMVQFLLERGASIEGEMRIYFVRSVRRARKEGCPSLADHLMQRGSWTKSDQALNDHPLILDEDYNPHWFYDEELNCWHDKLESSIPSDDNSAYSDSKLNELFHIDEGEQVADDSFSFEADESGKFGKRLDGVPGENAASQAAMWLDTSDLSANCGDLYFDPNAADSSMADRYEQEQLEILEEWKQEMAIRGIEIVEPGPSAHYKLEIAQIF
ncbi:ankyrin repeat-containing domain protein [Nemania serpens]|nr:ankyrin repeat-containing domain protein [Nemania serpens]